MEAPPRRAQVASAPEGDGEPACLLLFTKPAVPGRVKTRLIGALTPEQAAELHAAFLADLLARLRALSGVQLVLAWAVEAAEPLPAWPGLAAVRQRGGDLGERLHDALAAAAERHPLVAAIGSDHPDLPADRVATAFARLAAGADVVLGPAVDGGYYLIALRREKLSRRLFADIPWSGPEVLARTLDRCAELGLDAALLPRAADVDTPADLERLAQRLRRDPGCCPRTAALLAAWQPAVLPS